MRNTASVAANTDTLEYPGYLFVDLLNDCLALDLLNLGPDYHDRLFGTPGAGDTLEFHVSSMDDAGEGRLRLTLGEWEKSVTFDLGRDIAPDHVWQIVGVIRSISDTPRAATGGDAESRLPAPYVVSALDLSGTKLRRYYMPIGRGFDPTPLLTRVKSYAAVKAAWYPASHMIGSPLLPVGVLVIGTSEELPALLDWGFSEHRPKYAVGVTRDYWKYEFE